MHDQANDLRRLVRDCAAEDAATGERRPRLVVVAGGKGGVGTTTVAVNLSVAMARRQIRILLADADPRGGDVTILCGLEERCTLADVLAGKRTVVEVLQPGPGGIRVLPGLRGLQRLSDFSPAASERLLGQLHGLGAQTDVVILDVGSGSHEMTRRLRQAADLALVVTTPETPSILDSYALIKVLADNQDPGPIHVLVNRTPSAAVAGEVHGRLVRACRRFLGIPLPSAGHVPNDPRVPAAIATGQPLVTATPDCGSARQIGRLAQTLALLVGTGNTPPRRSKDQQTRITAEETAIGNPIFPENCIRGETKKRFNLEPPLADIG